MLKRFLMNGMTVMVIGILLVLASRYTALFKGELVFVGVAFVTAVIVNCFVLKVPPWKLGV